MNPESTPPRAGAGQHTLRDAGYAIINSAAAFPARRHVDAPTTRRTPIVRWRPFAVWFCAFFSSLYMVVKLPIFAPFFPFGSKEVLLLLVVAMAIATAIFDALRERRRTRAVSSAFAVGFLGAGYILAHLLVGASRETFSWRGLQLTLFPLLFIFVGGIQTSLRDALRYLCYAMVLTGVVALPFVFWDAVTGDAYVLNNVSEGRELLHLTWISYEGLRRQAGIFEGGLQLSSHLGLAVMASVYLIATKRLRSLNIALIPLFLFGMALSVSRLGAVAMIAGLLVLLGVTRDQRVLRLAGFASLIFVGLAILATFFPEGLSAFSRRFLDLLSGDAAQEARYDAWRRSVVTMWDVPFGTGIGTAGGKVSRDTLLLIPESTFLKIGVEFGIFAMLALLVVYVSTMRRMLTVVSRASVDAGPGSSIFDAAFLASFLVATFINHAFVQAIEYFSYGITSMMILGLSLKFLDHTSGPHADRGGAMRASN